MLRRLSRWLGATAVLCTFLIATAAASQDVERLYRNGVLPSGKPLVGTREAGVHVEGAGAACANCHRRSGLGSIEGRNVIPPITARYLFRPRGKQAEDLDFTNGRAANVEATPYTEATLVRAIRDGVVRDGRTLSYLMPRYALDDATLAALVEYLRGLSRDLAPGVDDDTLQFATIVTPDADPKARDGMLAVMQQFFSDKNEFIRGGHRPIKSTQRIEYRVTRRWQLHVWQLEGAPESWQKQLERHLAREPVFAVISGIGGADWSPVQRFCEQAKVPCLFPNVDLPVRDDSDFYSVYFSRGVLLDAALLAQTLQERVGASSPGRIVQVFREGDVGRAAARALGADPRLGGAQFVERSVPARGAAALKEALADLRDGDALVLWLRAADLAALPTPIPTHVSVYASGTMGGLENAPLAGEWRAVTRLVYPVELPQQRTVAMTFSRRWFKVRGVPVVDERVQTDTYIACGIVSETLGEMLDSFVRDYLVERIENMLSHRLANGYYRRLSLGPGQRYASKGGYLVRFAEPKGTGLAAESGWIVP